MRLCRKVLIYILILIVFFATSKHYFVLAINSLIKNDWTDSATYFSSSNVVTSIANKITLSLNPNWFNQNWKYRQSIGVSNSSGSTLTDYQIPIFVNTSTLISDSKMKNDCSDLRITDSIGTTLSYWIATSPSSNTCGQTTTKIWVKATSISTSGANLYLYYGNSSASSQSNGFDVFNTFADFTIGTSLPSTWTKTDIGTAGTYSVGGSLSISNTNGEDVWYSIYGATHVYKNSKINGSFIAEALVTSQSNANEWAKSGISIQNNMASGGGNGHAFIVVTPNNGVPFQYQSIDGDLCSEGSCPTVVAPNVNLGNVIGGISMPVFLKITKDSDNLISAYRSSNGASWTQQGNSDTPWGISADQYVSLFITPHNTSATGTATYTFFYTRKFSATEPSVSSPSNEEKIFISPGTLTSSIFDTGYSSIYGNINYGVTTPTNTSTTVKVRTSTSATMVGATDFASCTSISSGTDISTNNCVTDGHRYLQYQITLITSDNISTPIFNNISIQYSPPTYTISFLAASNGLISGSSSQSIEHGNDTSSVTATANSGYHFTNWSDSSTANPRIIYNVVANQSITANFAANDPNAPIISNINSSGNQISWTTDELASSQVQYGLNSSYGFSTSELDSSLRVLSHQVTLPDLKSCARYYYRVISKDTTNNQTASAQLSFNTTGCAVTSITSGIETTIPVTGGTVELVNNSSTAQLSVPNNYAAEQATFQINKLETAGAPTGPNSKSIANNNLYDLVAVTNSDQQLSTFSTPITFTISYGSDTETNFEESSLDVYKYDGSTWIKKDCTLNTTANTLTCSLTSFSTYGVLGTAKSNQTSSSSNSNSTSTNNNSSSDCNNAKPFSFPDLFQINTTNNSAKIFFTPLSDTNKYFISFSTNPNAEEHGAEVTLAREGVQNFTVNLLKPNTIYYLKVRGQNGCMSGDWSNIMKIKTDSKIYYKNNSSFSKKITQPKLINKKTTETISTITESPKTEIAKPIAIPNPEIKKKCFLWWCW